LAGGRVMRSTAVVDRGRAPRVFELITEDDAVDKRPPITRRRLLGVLVVSVATGGIAGGLGVRALLQSQPQPARVFKVVFLFTAINDPAVQTSIGITKQGLNDLGYIEGQHITYDGRSAERVPERFPALAAEVVAMSPDVIICQNPQAALALAAATRTIPIVFVGIGVDAVEAGIVASLARPDANLTGLSSAGAGIYAKRLELLKASAPSISRVAVIRDQAEPPQTWAEMQQAARSLGIELLPVNLRTAADLDPGLAAAVSARADALVYTNTANFIVGTQAAGRIAEFAIQNRWPAMLAPASGGLMNYAGVLVDPWRRAATYIDRILKGARPSDLPVEGPAGFTFVINMCTAAKLGLTIPQSVLAQATQVLQCAAR
jgi:putative ABC transport system substrate-binding protein